MQRRYSLKKRALFRYVYRRGRSAADRYFVVLYRRSGKLLVGLSVSKKLGGAVQRNRIKRLMRECLRPRLCRMRPGMYVIVARQGIEKASLAELSAAMEKLLARADLFGSEPGSNTAPDSKARGKKTYKKEGKP